MPPLYTCKVPRCTLLLGEASYYANTLYLCRYFHITCSTHAPRGGGEDDRDQLIEDDATSMQTENLMMSGLSQTSFKTASTFIINSHHAL